ncbi:unnamed protein product [Adineta ricciae]|uniref:Uncharacterized protein n=1 Tax=Adineta ricciae TaxID=249248 RepID=A0A815LE33_ADIRI|nr:unnamed protein product [Adineta ricciae]
MSIPFKSFVFHTIKYHPVCLSRFVSQQWIEELYLKDASTYGTGDFRSTASSQFQLLATLCSISQGAASQKLMDLDHNQFVYRDVLHENQVRSKVDGTIEFFKSNTSIQIITFFNYLRTTMQTNFLMSALNTNLLFLVDYEDRAYRFYTSEISYSKSRLESSTAQVVMDCSNTNPTSAVGFFSIFNNSQYQIRMIWSSPQSNQPLVHGFFTGCTSLEAILQSTLDCLYSMECLKLLATKFPGINRTSLKPLAPMPNSKQQNMAVKDHLVNLFIEEWSTEINYPKYFDECAPSVCTYTTSESINFFYAVTLFIGLYGGLTIIFRCIVLFLINIYWKLKCYSRNTNVSHVIQRTSAHKLSRYIKQVNLFKNFKCRTDNDIKIQKTTTIIYLILLTSSCSIIILLTFISPELATVKETDPSLSTYNNLYATYSQTLTCPCSSMIISHQNFITLSPIFHQICSSDFVKEEWIFLLRYVKTGYNVPDWRNRAFNKFRLLSDLCKLAKKMVAEAISHFFLQPFVVSNILSKNDFDFQINSTLTGFFRSTNDSFSLLIETERLLMQVDQPYSGPMGGYGKRVGEGNPFSLLSPTMISLYFNLTGPFSTRQESISCVCAVDINCRIPLSIYETNRGWTLKPNHTKWYTVPGSFAGCTATESLLLSTLECYYSNLNCLSIVMNYSKQIYHDSVQHSSWFDIRPLIYNSQSSRFSPNTSISAILKNIFIEQWNSSYSYDSFYKSCAPNHCTYLAKVRSKPSELLMKFISIIGGLIISLRLITPLLVKCFFFLCKNTIRKERQQQIRFNRFKQFKTILEKLFTRLCTLVKDLNIFPIHSFGSNTDQARAKHLGQSATRLYFILFSTILIILAIYNGVQPTKHTKTFERPYLQKYNELYQRYGDELKCMCSSIASPYDRFVKIETMFHEVCSSPFASNIGRSILTDDTISALTLFVKDYSSFLNAHLQFLQGLCQLSSQTINITIEQFRFSLFTTAELLSKANFDARLNLTIQQKQSSIPIAFTRLLLLIRNLNQGNAVISNYGTNFHYSLSQENLMGSYLPSKPMIYDNVCSCGLSSNCTTQATFNVVNSLEPIVIPGIKMGCIPSESFRASTLECFYNKSCIDLIVQYMNPRRENKSSNSLNPLSAINSRFSINTTIAVLIDNLFVEKWQTTIDYSLYYDQCSPLSCSYTYIQKFKLFHIVGILLSLQSGLSIVLQWICPKIVPIIVNIYQYRKRQRTIVHSTCTVEPISVENISTKNVSDRNLISQYVFFRINRCFFKGIIIFVLLLSIIAAIIVFSIYIVQQKAHTKLSIITTTSMITMTSRFSTTSITTVPTKTTTKYETLCKIIFQPIRIAKKFPLFMKKQHFIGDLNNDGGMDLALLNVEKNSLSLYMGNGFGRFETEIVYNDFKLNVTQFLFADFNNDNRLDRIIFSKLHGVLTVDLQEDRGRFDRAFYHIIGTDTKTIITADLDGDTCMDIAYTYVSSIFLDLDNYLGVIFGQCNGKFARFKRYDSGVKSSPIKMVVADFNLDGYLDISVLLQYSKSIGIFLGYGNGTFQEQKISPNPGLHFSESFVVGNFNNDSLADVAISYANRDYINVMFGYGNGSLGETKVFYIGDTPNYELFVNDFNGDQFLDIGFGRTGREINVLIGDGNGNYELQTVHTTSIVDRSGWISITDLNNDGRKDMIDVDESSGTYDILLNTCE